MVQRLLKIMLLVAACGLFIANAHATIIVSGDASITRMISTTIPQIYNQGDQQFFENIVNGSTDIAVVNKYGTNLFAGDINTFYQSLGNVNSTLISTITETSLGNADMLIIPVPEDAFSNEEMVLMNSYINGGGAVFFLGDCSNFSSNNAIINQTL